MKVNASEAVRILGACEINLFDDFDTLPTYKIQHLLQHAERVGYHRTWTTTGSRARYFHAYLLRAIKRYEGD